MILSDNVILYIYNNSNNSTKLNIIKTNNWNFNYINPYKNAQFYFLLKLNRLYNEYKDYENCRRYFMTGDSIFSFYLFMDYYTRKYTFYINKTDTYMQTSKKVLKFMHIIFPSIQFHHM